MCTPAAIAITSAVIAIGGEVANYVSQGDQAYANKKAALQAQRLQMQQIGIRQQQIQEGGAETILGIDRKARQAEALARVSAGESNVAGVSVDALLNDL